MPEHNQNQFANNLNQFSDNENTTENVNQQMEKRATSRLQNEIGAKVLTLVNFESKHKDIVESSFNKARQNKEKLPGKNNERRNFAYLSRLDRMVEKYGNKAEQKIWEASAENVVMDYEDIPEAYWKQQEQILRDNGQGRKLSEYEKEILAEDLIDKQRQSITSWTNYLGDKNCPYPLWFKVYAFDGISKMSNALNLDDADYSRRDNTTALSFPKLNAEILAKVYRQINDFYGVDKENWLSKNSDDEKLVSLVKSANFPKLYAKELVDTKVILKTPERTEDVHGDWFEYKLGDEEEIASLAEGTKWCVVDPNVAHNYLVYGQYSNPEEDDDYDQDYEDDEDWEDDDIKVEDPEAKFIIFRLEDPNTPGVFASNGSASIRLDPNGIVDEISGLNEGQAVEDALVPIVKEKALSLPGGEKYLQKFDDKQTLIKLDNKMKEGEDLTKEELSFLYELDRPIATLDTYNEEDPRIPELKEKYDLEYALEKGVDANKMVASLDSCNIAKNLDTLLEHGADINNTVNHMKAYDIAKNLDSLLKQGANINNTINNMDSYRIAKNLDTLLKYSAIIDVNELVSELKTYEVSENLETLLKNGADIDLVVNRMRYSDIVDKLDYLIEHGANIDVNELVSRLNSFKISDNLDTLLKNGADINVALNKMDPYYIVNKLDFLIEHGANIDVNELVSELKSYDILQNLDTLLKNGADIDLVVGKIKSHDIVYKLDFLLARDANIDVNELVSELGSYDISQNLDTLLKNGADINNIVSNMNPRDIDYKLFTLLENGADIDNILSNMKPDRIADNLVTLLVHGVDANLITEKLSKKEIEDNIDILRIYGANLDMY